MYWWEPGKLKKQIRSHEADRQCNMFNWQRIDETGWELVPGKTVGVASAVTYKDLLKHNSINCSSVMIKREVALEFPMCYDKA